MAFLSLEMLFSGEVAAETQTLDWNIITPQKDNTPYAQEYDDEDEEEDYDDNDDDQNEDEDEEDDRFK